MAVKRRVSSSHAANTFCTFFVRPFSFDIVASTTTFAHPLDSFESRSSADSRGPCTDSPTHPSLKQTYNPSWVQGERVPVSDRTANEATTQRSVPAGGVLRDGQRLFSHRPKHAIALLPALYVREHRECDAADGDGRRDDKTERTALLPWLAPGRPSFAAIRAVPRSVTVAAERVNDTTT